MIQVRFSQYGSPYVDELPITKDGSKGVVGCGALAVARIMYYYRNPGCEALEEQYLGDEYPILEALPATTFNWDNILPKYKEGEYTQEQGEEVAKLMKYVGYAIKTEYSPFFSGSWIPTESLYKLGFSTDTYNTGEIPYYEIGSNNWWILYNDWKISDEELENLLDRELEQGRPVLMCGYNKAYTSGHWYVVDGRDENGNYHIDFGYFKLSQELFKTTNNYLLTDGSVLYTMLNRVWCVVPIIYNSTNINNIKTSNNTTIYNLQGQPIKNPSKGIYIKNGKKYIIR